MDDSLVTYTNEDGIAKIALIQPTGIHKLPSTNNVYNNTITHITHLPPPPPPLPLPPIVYAQQVMRQIPALRPVVNIMSDSKWTSNSEGTNFKDTIWLNKQNGLGTFNIVIDGWLDNPNTTDIIYTVLLGEGDLVEAFGNFLPYPYNCSPTPEYPEFSGGDVWSGEFVYVNGERLTYDSYTDITIGE